MQDSLILFLMTRKGFGVLEALEENFRGLIDFVVTASDKNIQDDCRTEIQELCARLKIPCYDRRDHPPVKSKYAIAVSWRWLINLEATELIVFHDSLLPEYRGFNPLVSYLINGESKIGVTALFAEAEYDCGKVIGQAASEITYPIKIAAAVEIISRNYAELAQQIASRISRSEKLEGVSQNESEATYSLWRDDEDYFIDWTRPAHEIRRLVDSVGFPYKGAVTRVKERLVRVLDAEEIDDVTIENRKPGKVIFVRESLPIVVCGEGLLKIKTLIDDKTGESLLPLQSFRSRFN